MLGFFHANNQWQRLKTNKKLNRRLTQLNKAPFDRRLAVLDKLLDKFPKLSLDNQSRVEEAVARALVEMLGSKNSVEIIKTLNVTICWLDMTPWVKGHLVGEGVLTPLQKLLSNCLVECQLGALEIILRLAYKSPVRAEEIVKNDAVPKLFYLLKSPTNSVRENASGALFHLLNVSEHAKKLSLTYNRMMQLTSSLGDESNVVQYIAINILVMLSLIKSESLERAVQSDEFLLPLFKLTENESDELRVCAMRCLKNLAANYPKILERFVELQAKSLFILLDDVSPTVCFYAASLLIKVANSTEGVQQNFLGQCSLDELRVLDSCDKSVNMLVDVALELFEKAEVEAEVSRPRREQSLLSFFSRPQVAEQVSVSSVDLVMKGM